VPYASSAATRQGLPASASPILFHMQDAGEGRERLCSLTQCTEFDRVMLVCSYMAPPKVRADYDQLLQVGRVLMAQADASRQSIERLQSQTELLRSGDWLGRGATAFYKEMDSVVMPAMMRLESALSSGQQSISRANAIMNEAETEVARLFRGNTDLLGGLLAAGGQAIAGIVQGMAAALNAIGRAQEDAAVDGMLSKFNSKVRDLVKQSPTLRAQMLQLQKAGYSFKTGPVSGGYYTDPVKKEIIIDQPLADATTVSHIAHEVGHGVSSQLQSIPATPQMTRAQYVKANVDNLMHNEGEAQFNAAQVRAELKGSGGPDIGIPGTQTAAYQKVYDRYTGGRITKDQAINQMATLMGNERVSTPPRKPYRDSYADAYRNDWDKNIAPGRISK
jgi:WXG100 family type VII secretion target